MSNLRRKKLHRTNQGSNFLGGSFSNTDHSLDPLPPPPPLLHKAGKGGVDFFKIDGNGGGGLKIFARKGGGVGKMGGGVV